MIQESFGEFDVPWRNDLVCGWNPLSQSGEFTLSDAPDLGLELDLAAIADHPYVQHAFPSLWDPQWTSKFYTIGMSGSAGIMRDIPHGVSPATF